jgi:hypothetical protein
VDQTAVDVIKLQSLISVGVGSSASGSGFGNAFAVAVPEPGSAVLFLLEAVLLLRSRRLKRRRADRVR